MASSSWPCQLLGWYLTTLAVFHWSEYYATAITNPRHLALDSYILNHSSAYHAAVVSSFVEFFMEYYFFPGSHLCNRLRYPSTILCRMDPCSCCKGSLQAYLIMFIVYCYYFIAISRYSYCHLSIFIYFIIVLQKFCVK